MKSRFSSRSAALVVGLVGTALAFAQPAQSPFYVGGALGASSTDGNYSSQVQSAGSPRSGYTFNSAERRSGSEFAGRIYAGYRLNPMFAIELGYSNFGSHDVAYRLNRNAQFLPANSPYIVNGRNKLNGISLDVVGTLPINSLFSVNARAGVIATNLRYNENISNPVAINGTPGIELSTFSAPKEHQTRFHWGVGTSYQLNPKLALTLDYQRVQGVGNTFAWTDSGNGKLNYNLISAGARFSF
jgi:opacity protein-like surface antigen